MGVKVYVHPRKKARDIGKSSRDLIDLIKRSATDPNIKETDVGAAIRVLASRGIDPKTGRHVGIKEALKSAREMGDFAAS